MGERREWRFLFVNTKSGAQINSLVFKIKAKKIKIKMGKNDFWYCFCLLLFFVVGIIGVVVVVVSFQSKRLPHNEMFPIVPQPDFPTKYLLLNTPGPQIYLPLGV